MYWKRKRLYSQNFLVNRELIEKLIRWSSISKFDTVLDIGSGEGSITQELFKVTSEVIAIEKDPKYTSHPQDFLTYILPDYPYKVFANIPFSITGEIVRKLLMADNPPTDCYLVMQEEAARKFMANSTNTMAAVLYYPWWEIRVVHKFRRTDFYPKPNVDSVLLQIKPRKIPLVPIVRKRAYCDFVAYNFVYNPQAKYIATANWAGNFQRNRKNLSGFYDKLLQEQKLLHKIHRT